MIISMGGVASLEVSGLVSVEESDMGMKGSSAINTGSEGPSRTPLVVSKRRGIRLRRNC